MLISNALISRYFMKELLSKEVIKKMHLPVYLTSWVDKTS
jgi:hypothetical protein